MILQILMEMPSWQKMNLQTLKWMKYRRIWHQSSTDKTAWKTLAVQMRTKMALLIGKNYWYVDAVIYIWFLPAIKDDRKECFISPLCVGNSAPPPLTCILQTSCANGWIRNLVFLIRVFLLKKYNTLPLTLFSGSVTLILVTCTMQRRKPWTCWVLQTSTRMACWACWKCSTKESSSWLARWLMQLKVSMMNSNLNILQLK